MDQLSARQSEVRKGKRTEDKSSKELNGGDGGNHRGRRPTDFLRKATKRGGTGNVKGQRKCNKEEGLNDGEPLLLGSNPSRGKGLKKSKSSESSDTEERGAGT